MHGHVGTPQRRLEMARVERRCAHHHGDAIEGCPPLRVREHHARDLHAFAALARRRQARHRCVVIRDSGDIGGLEEADLHAPQRPWRPREIGVVDVVCAGSEIGHEALQPRVAGWRREQH